MKLLLIALIAIGHSVLAEQQRECCEEYCYGKDSEKLQTKQYATKTAYEIIKGKDLFSRNLVPHCTPVKIWTLSRHGTRLPNTETIDKLHLLKSYRDEIVKNYKERRTQPDRGALCNEDLYGIQSWKLNSNLTRNFSNNLTLQGWMDMKFLAGTYKRLYPRLLDNYISSGYLFRHTGEQRTEASFKAFVEGLFGQNAYERIRLEPTPQRDTLLKPYEYCEPWKKQDKEKFNSGSELYKFENSDIMMETLRNISRRLGYLYTLQREQIDLIWDICRFEQAWYVDRMSPWCAAFTPNEVSVLEYSEDLKYYYKSGHGNELNSRVACEAVQDMIKHLERKTAPDVVAYFTHSATVQLFLTALGIAKDRDDLRADNFYSMNRRSWKTSLISPFAANIFAVKYECPDDIKDKNKILFLLNQHPIHLDWCKVGLCDWSDLINRYERFVNADCSKLFCENSGFRLSISLTLIITLLMYLHFLNY